ncbi:MAG: hypothetical protein OXH75_15695 [Acidobacteria bacterium]|nr:hypothetical protein [Acidobacteriota bacterium]
MQPLECSEPLIHLPELNLDAANPIIETPDVCPDFSELRTLICANSGDLNAQGDDRANDDSDDPLGVPARHAGSTVRPHPVAGNPRGAGRSASLLRGPATAP